MLRLSECVLFHAEKPLTIRDTIRDCDLSIQNRRQGSRRTGKSMEFGAKATPFMVRQAHHERVFKFSLIHRGSPLWQPLWLFYRDRAEALLRSRTAMEGRPVLRSRTAMGRPVLRSISATKGGPVLRSISAMGGHGPPKKIINHERHENHERRS